MMVAAFNQGTLLKACTYLQWQAVLCSYQVHPRRPGLSPAVEPFGMRSNKKYIWMHVCVCVCVCVCVRVCVCACLLHLCVNSVCTIIAIFHYYRVSFHEIKKILHECVCVSVQLT